MALPAGRYDVWITSPHVSTEIHAIQNGGLDLQPGAIVERDLTLPGITLRGQVPGDWIVSAARGAYRAETTVQEGDGGASVEFVRKK